MSNFAKRKRNSKDIRCLFFPDVNNGFIKREAVVGRSNVKLSSAIKSWERCGEGFMGTPTAQGNQANHNFVFQKYSSRKNITAVRQLVPSSSDQVTGSAVCEADIVWNSSESELSDSEMHQLNTVTEGCGVPRKEVVKNSYSRYCSLFSSVTYPKEEEIHQIDWDSDLTDDGEEMDSLAEISDSDSSSKDKKQSPKVILAPDAEISDFSDGERAECTAQARCEHVSWKPGGSNRRSASDWVRSVQAMLRTPQKQHSHIKSPEDSAKKKKFLSGGLAERLSRLQCRQRSAISFWKHQFISDCTTPAVGKAGVLSLKLLSVWEDCNMHVATCQVAETSVHPCPSGTGQLLALFSRDTVAHLAPNPGDTVHVYPQWQKLLMEGESNPVILNTHFSQKVLKDGAHTGGRVSTGKCTPYSLTRVFCLKNSVVSEEMLAAKQREPWGVGEAMCDSLLEVIEGHGAAGWMERDVSVVVQRVYCLRVQEPSSQHLLRHRVPETESLQPRYRLCLLVQDAYGLFSEVALHTLALEDHLQQHIRKWEGSWCVLRGMKVLQRATRARAAGLFSLIDSLWPPMVPLRVHGKDQSSQDDRAKLPATSFCYLLSAQRGEDSVDELLHPAPGLYQPAVVHTLREILQRIPHGHRCSFTATVIYRRQQGSGPKQSEFWLFITDPSLQREEEKEEEGELNRTLGVCVSSSCVLHSAVLKALSTSPVCSLTFKDAVREHGLIRCVERSVIQLDTLTSMPASDGPATEDPLLLRPVKLDLLGPATTANSLCMLQGEVVGVAKDTAYSWPVCNLCGSDRLEALHGEQKKLFCSLCDTTVVSPTMKMQLEVFLSCTSFSQCTVKIKLQQDTIMSVLNSTPSGSEGYMVENVLGKEVGPLATYVRVVTRKPVLWVSLEEIGLSKGYSNEVLQEPGPASRNERERI